jgi:hypothetical protein
MLNALHRFRKPPFWSLALPMASSFATGPQVVVRGCGANATSSPCGLWTVDATLSASTFTTCTNGTNTSVALVNTAPGFPVYTRSNDGGPTLFGYTYINQTAASAWAVIGTTHCASSAGVLYSGTFTDLDQPYSASFNRGVQWVAVNNATAYALTVQDVPPPPPSPPRPPPPPSPPPRPPPSPRPLPPVPKWYENNTVLTVTTVGGLMLVIYTVGILWLVIYYRVVKPKAERRKEFAESKRRAARAVKVALPASPTEVVTTT